MIKKSINRRSNATYSKQSLDDERHQKATKTVAKNYQQDKDAAVYSKYFAYKRKNGPTNHETDSN